MDVTFFGKERSLEHVLEGAKWHEFVSVNGEVFQAETIKYLAKEVYQEGEETSELVDAGLLEHSHGSYFLAAKTREAKYRFGYNNELVQRCIEVNTLAYVCSSIVKGAKAMQPWTKSLWYLESIRAKVRRTAQEARDWLVHATLIGYVRTKKHIREQGKIQRRFAESRITLVYCMKKGYLLAAKEEEVEIPRVDFTLF